MKVLRREAVRRFVLAAVVAPALIVACSRQESRALPDQGHRAESIRTENTEPRFGRIEFVESGPRFGLGGAADEVFSQIIALAVAPDGSIVTYDAGAGIKRFDPSGSFSGWLAREGNGPEEVVAVQALAMSPEGAVAAYDLGNRRLTVFDGSGGVVWSVRAPAGMPRYHEDALHFDEDGALWVGLNPIRAVDRVALPRPAYARVLSDGELTDTVWVDAAAAPGCPLRSERRYSQGFWEDKREPWFPKLEWARSPGGATAVGCPARYEVVLQRSGTIVSLSREWTPVEATDEERAFLEQWVGLDDVPSARPAYARLILTDDDRLWVWPNQPSEAWEPTAALRRQTGVARAWRLSSRGAFDIFSKDGEWLAQAELPPQVRYSGFPTHPSVVIRGDTLWAASWTDLDVQFVGRYVLEWSGGQTPDGRASIQSP